MKKLSIAAMFAAGLIALTACGGKGDDKVAQAYDNQADSLDAQADNLEAQADNLRDEGDRKEDAIDASDVDVTKMNAADQARVANSM